MSYDIKSPLIYPGSKGSVIHELLPLITEVEFKEYREPFIGSASIYLAVRQQCGGRDCGKIYWINDLNLELYNFWKMMQRDAKGVITKALEFKNDKRFDGRGKELFYHLKRSLSQFKNEGKRIELAAAYYILNRSAFSGGTLVSGFSQNHYNYITDERIKDLKNIGKLLMNSDVRITHLDYQKLVEIPPISGINEDVIVMADPPYWAATESGLYGQGGKKWDNTHKTFDHYRFAEAMKVCKYRFIITYDDSPFIRNLFKWANQKQWTFTHKMRKDKVGKELLISNFALKDIIKTKQLSMEDYA